VNWALPGAILFLLGLVLLLGYFLSKKVFPAEETGEQGAHDSGRSPCDGCSEAGCGGFAKALVRGGSEGPGEGTLSGNHISWEDAPADAANKSGEMKAVIRCNGRGVSLRYHYSGAPSCRAAAAMAAHPKECANACLGFGDCVPTCPAHAIRIECGVAAVVPSRCDGCRECLQSCPVELIEMIPAEKGVVVLCKGPSGPSADGFCPEGCTLCDRCIESCPEGALVRTEGGVPRWIQEKCNGCGACLEACPQGVILLLGSPGEAKEACSSATANDKGSEVRGQGSGPHASPESGGGG
jgi:Fe-S-cluster-containing hydrogenase component 2